MKGSALFLVSVTIHFALALVVVLSLVWLPDYRGRASDGTAVGVVLFIASIYILLGFALLKARTGSPRWIKTFAIGGGIFVGNLIGFGGWEGGLIFSVPLVTGLYALWRRGMLTNTAFESGRAKSGAPAQRER